MKRLAAPGRLAAILLILLSGAASGQASAPAPIAWVQAVDGGGFEARLMTGAATCPVMHTDHGDVASPGGSSDRSWHAVAADYFDDVIDAFSARQAKDRLFPVGRLNRMDNVRSTQFLEPRQFFLASGSCNDTRPMSDCKLQAK